MTKYSIAIKDWPENERPRERLIKWGPDKLTDVELLAIIIRVGDSGNSAIDLARELLHKFKGFRGLDTKSIIELCEIKGIGLAKAAQIKATLEMGKRLLNEKSEEMYCIKQSKDVDSLLGPILRDLSREVFKILLLTSRNKLILEKTIFEGSLTESLVNPREIIKVAVNEAAASIVFVHNHPSGNPNPSFADKQLTKQLIDACNLVKIKVIDHIIIGKESYFSFADKGMM